MNKFRKYTRAWIRKESRPKKLDRAGHILARLKKTYPTAKIALSYENPIQMLVAVMLSAQCTDKKVNEVTKELFQKYKSVGDFAGADLKTLESEIRPTGFYHTKARHIIRATQIIQREFKGEIPKTMAELITLPGVARKTANIVLGNVYGVIDGVAVDTHVSRISQRLGLTHTENTTKIEKDLMELFPKREWLSLTYYIIEHGRALCTARNRKCERCPLKDICPSSLA